ncbi:hypothetical protein ACHQM5_004137 [Ranunculus cassubicifolius]
MADHQRNTTFREYRKGNWTVHETMILITAKKMDEERRMKRNNGGGESSEGRSRPAELRWKWVEDYCWSNGCLRSQNQCNDKWDNLMRDYKKVRDYESRLAQNSEANMESYWKLERHERKDKNLPTSLLLQIYEALVEVVERKGVHRLSNSGGGSGTVLSYVLQQPVATVQLSLPPPAPLLHHYPSSDPTPTPSPPLPLQLPPPPPFCQSLPTLDSDTSEYPEDSPAKRRRKGENVAGTSNSNEEDEVGSAISRSASLIADALQSCEQQEERRHREFLNLQERKLKMEESRNESDKETMNGLVHAINGLASSIFSLVSEKNPRAP